MKQLDYYKKLFTSQYQNSPKLLAWAEVNFGILHDATSLIENLVIDFDLDSAVGNQLDILGIIIGVGREIAVPIDDMFFSWDDGGDSPAFPGWDLGVWYDDNSLYDDLRVLPDEHYRLLLKAKVAANQWDGSAQGMQAAWNFIYSGTDKYVTVFDNQDMTIIIGILDPDIDDLTKALITRGYLPLKPQGVEITYVFGGPFFAWGIDTVSAKGWGEAYWQKRVTNI